MDIQDRLKEVFSVLKINQTNFAKNIGLQVGNISAIMNGVNKPSADTLKLISEYYKINLNWLLTGEGSMFIPDSPTLLPSFSESQAMKIHTDIINIPILDIKASAGYGIEGFDNPNVTGYFPLPKQLIGSKKESDVVCLEIAGDSMEPEFKDGDLVLCLVGKIDSDGLYVINIDGYIFFKRLQFIRPEKILIKSINTAYETITITNDEEKYFGIIGKVFRHIRNL